MAECRAAAWRQGREGTFMAKRFSSPASSPHALPVFLLTPCRPSVAAPLFHSLLPGYLICSLSLFLNFASVSPSPPHFIPRSLLPTPLSISVGVLHLNLCALCVRMCVSRVRMYTCVRRGEFAYTHAHIRV
eukprot:6206291-Pleurochrysis_carterae.AAC.3